MEDTANKDKMEQILEKINNEKIAGLALLLNEHKGEDTVVIDMAGECSWTDYFMITTVRSQAHLGGLMRHLDGFFREHGYSSPLNKHKNERGQGWVLLDCGDVVIHLMEKDERAFYELEKLWFKGKVYSLPAN